MKRLCIILLSVLSSFIVWAQEENNHIEISIDQPDDNWYASPWVWVVGAALIIVLLVVLSKKKESQD
ncbi:MAG TPA: hypothetical protein VGN63_24680 [Flavisolibacter sp.]|jgi:ABC-type uncharacterized transport system fused permease/ATPase subunit|nr:hypothetical protein [Flavisolibacter sp.]